MSFFDKKVSMPGAGEALPGRSTALPVPEKHFVLGTPLEPPFPAGSELALFGMGCFWGAERDFWQAPGVISTAVGYAAGITPNPLYEEVCSGRTAHNEVVRWARALTPEELDRSGGHPRRASISVREMIERIANHDRTHTTQLLAIRREVMRSRSPER